MKRYVPFLFGTLFGVLLLAAFIIGQASAAPLAATGCFPDTNGHWAEPFICWAAEKGIVSGFPDGTYGPNQGITRAQAAVMLKNQAEIPPSTGDHYFNVGANEWRTNSASSNAYVNYFTLQSHLRASNSGFTKGFQVTPTLPSAVYGTETYFKGVLFCYKTYGSVYLDEVQLLHSKYSGHLGTTTILKSYIDYTNRVGNECRLYEFTNPSNYWPDNMLSLLVEVYFADTVSYLQVYSTVFILGPSDRSAGYIYGSIAPDVLMQEPDSNIEPMLGPETGE